MAEIADKYCFSSNAHFSTAFRQMFGYTPVAARSITADARVIGSVFDRWQEILGAILSTRDQSQPETSESAHRMES